MGYLTEEQAIQTIETTMNRKFNDEQRAILTTKGGMSMAAVAGSGKTTTLVALITKRRLTGEIVDASKILCTTFSKVGATELEDRLSSLSMALNLAPIKVTTLHATCYQILQHFGVHPNLMKDSENYSLISQAVSEVMGRRVYLELDVLENISSTISILDNSLLTMDELMTSGKYLLDYSPVEFENIVSVYRNTKQMMGKYTFDDLLIGVYQWLCIAKSEVVLQYVHEQFQYLFLDEFQDTNKVQFEIIKAILNLDPAARPQDRLVVVGDDDQNIYEWRGTDPRIMINIRSVVDVKKMGLSTNYRCKSNISNVAMNCVRNMGTRQDKTMHYAEGNEGGIVELIDPKHYTLSTSYNTDLANYSQLVADRLIKDVKEGTIAKRRTCIMARTNAEMAILANILLRNNISVKQVASMCISRSQVWQGFKQIIDLAKPFNGSYKLQGLLWQLVPYASSKLENVINDISISCQCSIDYAIEYLFEVADYAYYRHYVRDEIDSGLDKHAGKGSGAINARTVASAEYLMSKFTAQESLIELINALRSEEKLKCLLNLWYACLMDKQGRIHLAFKDYLRATALQYDKLSDIENYIAYTEQAENCSDRAVHNNSIEIRTIHGSKGMEWSVVYILADDNQSFPDFNKLHALCNTSGIKYETIKDVVDSERRLHYVAQTRAKNELYFVANRRKASVFLEETFGYVYKPSEDAYKRAQMQNRGLNDENGRIIWKAGEMEIEALNLPKTTYIKN